MATYFARLTGPAFFDLVSLSLSLSLSPAFEGVVKVAVRASIYGLRNLSSRLRFPDADPVCLGTLRGDSSFPFTLLSLSKVKVTFEGDRAS